MTAERLSALDASFLAVESAGRADARRLGVDLRPAGGRLAPALPGALRAPRRRASRTPRAGGASSRPCRSGSPSRPGPTTPTSTPPSTSCTRAAPTSTRSSTRSSPSRSRATARCGRSGSPTSSTDSVVLIGKAHHCMVDGIAIVELGKLLLDAEPYEERPEAEAWEPAPVPSSRERFVRAIADRAADGAALAIAPVKLASSPRRSARRARPRPHAPAHAAPARARRSALNRAGSPRRHHVRTSRPLDELRTIRRRFGVTPNDVVLAACAGALRRFAGPQRLKVMVPADVRGAGDAEDGNRISFVFLELPCDEPDPVARLRRGPRRHLGARRRRRGRGPRRGVPRARARPDAGQARARPRVRAPAHVEPDDLERPGPGHGPLHARLQAAQRPLRGPAHRAPRALDRRGHDRRPRVLRDLRRRRDAAGRRRAARATSTPRSTSCSALLPRPDAITART